MTPEELKAFKENVAVPRMQEILEKTVVPEGLCILDNLQISFLDGRSCGVDTLIEASGLVYKCGKVSEYFYKELDVSVDEFVNTHEDCVLLSEAKLQVWDELREIEIKTIMQSVSDCAKIFPELYQIGDMKIELSSIVWEKMKSLFEQNMEKNVVRHELDKTIANAKERSAEKKFDGRRTEEPYR